MILARQQSGYAILLMLIVLLGTGVAGLGKVSYLYGSNVEIFTKDQYALQAARQSLLSYTTLYPYHYGARGAGPGHLPCPDTDSMDGAARELSTDRDGPNPPCGGNIIARGQLPRHVNLPGHRYVFHVEPYQRFEYGVSSQLINNPVNRVVNDAVIEGEQGATPFLAWIRQPHSDEGASKTVLSQVGITRQALLPGVRQVVSAWFAGRVNRHGTEACLSLPQHDTAPGLSDSHYLLSLIAVRDSAPDGLALPVSADEELHACPADSLTSVNQSDWLLEDVPLAFHWFVRNGWHERIAITVSEHCTGEILGTCRLVPDPESGAGAGGDGRLRFTWQDIS